MQLNTEMLDDNILVIALDGRLDLEGTNAIDMQFTMLTMTQKNAILVDLSKLSFLASVGMRLLLSGAQGCAAKGGKLVLCKPQPMVDEVLKRSGVASLVPVYADEQAAKEALRDFV